MTCNSIEPKSWPVNIVGSTKMAFTNEDSDKFLENLYKITDLKEAKKYASSVLDGKDFQEQLLKEIKQLKES